MKIKLTFSYDGSQFSGFQIQKNSKHIHTVSGFMTYILKRLNINTSIVGSGRTDTKVHALAQVAHCEIPLFWSDLHKLKIKLNNMLAPFVHVKNIELVDESFSARFSAKRRLYRYALYTGEYQPFLANYALHVDKIDTKKLNIILKNFIGKHEFTYFKKSGGGNKSDIRTIYNAGAYQYKDFTIIYVLGNSFLRSQIRMMCNFSLNVMQDKYTDTQLKEQLECKIKHSTNLSIPNGLYLSKIFY